MMQTEESHATTEDLALGYTPVEEEVTPEPVETPPDPAVEPGAEAESPAPEAAADDAEAAPPLGDAVPDGAPAEAAAEVVETPPSEEAPTAPESPRTPFTPRVDGTTVEVPDAYVDDKGEIRGLTLENFRRHIQQPFMGDRRAWNQQVQRYERELRALADENRPEIQKANLFAEKILEILDMDPVDRDDELDKLKRDIPVLVAKAEAEAAKRQADAYRGEAQERDTGELVKRVMPVLEDGLEEYVTNALQHEQLKDAGLNAQEIKEALWEEFGPRDLFAFGVKPEEAHLDTPGGLVALRFERIDRFLLNRAKLATTVKSEAEKRIQAAEERAKKAEAAVAAARKNAQALKKEEAPPVVPVSGGPSAGETVKPWHDETKSWEERQALWNEHAKKEGYL